jgi:hypothetical protein
MRVVCWRAVLGLALSAGAAACGGGGDGLLGPSLPSGAPTAGSTATPTARYQVTFDATWSVQSHPRDFPPNPHFSPLVGGTHSARENFWEPGRIASDGIEAMAERGNPSLLADEIRAAVGRGNAEFVLRGDPLALSPGSVGLEFAISDRFPLVTLVTMVAPSPDWFVGVHDLPLLEDGAWVEELRVVLFAYDAGTDSGGTYVAPDLDTRPRQPIGLIDGPPLRLGGRVAELGAFTFKRLE